MTQKTEAAPNPGTEAGAAQPTQSATPESAGATTETAPKAAPAPTLLGSEPGNEQQKPADGASPKAEDQPAKDANAEPQDYTFTVPEHVTIQDDVLTDLKGVAGELKLTQEQAQKIADLGVKQAERFVAAQQEQIAKADAEWRKTVETDPEIGGDKLVENMAVANRALARFGSPALVTLLKESRLGNHPEVVRAFVKIGRSMMDDTVVPGARSAAATSLYPNSNFKN